MSLDRARRLLDASARLYDGHPDLAAQARRSAGSAFDGGAAWMYVGLERLRRRAPHELPTVPWQRWGVFKYGACVLAGLAGIAAAVALGAPWLAPLVCVVAFYAVEAQMVFLFPVLLDDVPRPLQTARRLTRGAGGTLSVMITVLPLAATMLFGGLAGRGFVRSWCLGCGAVLVWYDELAAPDFDTNPVAAVEPADAGVAPSRRTSGTTSSSRLGLSGLNTPQSYRHSRPGHLVGA